MRKATVHRRTTRTALVLSALVPAASLSLGRQARAADTGAPTFDARAAVGGLPQIAFTNRHHLGKVFGMGTIYCWRAYKPGGGIYVYDPARPDTPAREILRRDYGAVYDMSPSFDAKKLLFSWMAIKPGPDFEPTGEVSYRKNIDSFHIYEIGVDGTGLRQITTGRFHDVHPIYLADGRIPSRSRPEP